MRFDAIVRNFIILGEAAKNVPAEMQGLDPDIPWRSITGFRDVVAHQYFQLDPDVLWDGIQQLLPELAQRLGALEAMLPAVAEDGAST